MKIAIEAQRIFRVNKHGMDFVILEVLKCIQKMDTQNEYYVYVSGGEDRCLSETENMHIIELKCPIYPLWEQIVLPLAIRRLKPDLLHCTSNTAPIFCNVPLVLTLHDIIFLEKRQNLNRSLYQNLGWYYRKLVVPKILYKCKKIITVSDFECNRIQEKVNLSKDKVVTIYNGYNNYFKRQENSYKITSSYLKEKDYMFFLGNTDPKKNTIRTLKAYSIYLRQSVKKMPLLIADLSEVNVDIILKSANIMEIKPYLRFSGYIKNADLPYIYSGAKVFIYTSLRESFGIPILEAMACGTPLITSNTSSMPEIAGKSAVLIDPYKEEDIADAILKIENDDAFSNKIVEYGLERVKSFSWTNTTNKILQLYNKIQ